MCTRCPFRAEELAWFTIGLVILDTTVLYCRHLPHRTIISRRNTVHLDGTEGTLHPANSVFECPGGTHLDLANADAVHRDAEVVKYLEEEEEKEVQFYMIFGDLSISYSD